jgi:hypothetical protein
MVQSEFNGYFRTPYDDESEIRKALEQALPLFRWSEGDSAWWDKVRVWGEQPGAWIYVYRYESGDPFELTIRMDVPEGQDAEQAMTVLRDAVVRAVRGTLHYPEGAGPSR